MMKRRLFPFVFAAVAMAFVGTAFFGLNGYTAFATSSDLGLGEFAAQRTGLPTDTPAAFASRIIRWVLGILGVIMVALFVYGGMLYATSAGSEDRVKTGKSVMLYAVVGAVIVFASFIIAQFVLSAVSQGQESVFGPSYPFPQQVRDVDQQIRTSTGQPTPPAQGSNDCFVNDQNQTCCRQAGASGYSCYAKKASNASQCYVDAQQQLCCPGVFGTYRCSR